METVGTWSWLMPGGELGDQPRSRITGWLAPAMMVLFGPRQ
jgi:hypothetical protein